MTTAAFAIQSTPSTISYYDSKGIQHIYAFAIGDNLHLVVNYSDGYGWYWADQGLPSGPNYWGLIRGIQPVAITYASGGKQLIYVFADASYMGYEHLVVNYWDGSHWHWADQALPAGFSYFPIGLTAMTYANPSSGQQMIDVFISGQKDSDFSLYTLINSWDGSKWTWAEHPVPVSIPDFYPLTAITYQQSLIQRKYVFGVADNGHLIVHYTLDGINWSWKDQVTTGTHAIVGSPMAITFPSGGQQLIYVFATADNGHLVVNYGDGVSNSWADQGLPPSPTGTTAAYNPTAITYASGGRQLIYVFAGASNASGPTSLVVNYWDGSHWYWADQGIPSQFTWECNPLVSNLPFASSAITFLTAGSWVPQILVFAEGGSYCGATGTPWLVLNYWNGIGWYWDIQGNM